MRKILGKRRKIASILLGNSLPSPSPFTKKELAAEALHITAKDMSEMQCIDGVVPEPEGGAHTDHEAAAALLDATLQQHLAEVKGMPLSQLLDSRYHKFRNMVQFFRQEV